MVIPAADKLACIEREIKFREFVYPRRIESGKMTKRIADREIAVMRAIKEDYRELVAKEMLL